MRFLCDLTRRDRSDELSAIGDYCIIEKRGMTDDEFTARVLGLKDSLTPKSFLQKAVYFCVHGRTPVEKTRKFITGLKALAALKDKWPNYRALLLTCPDCKVPFTSTKDHVIVDQSTLGLSVSPELACPYSKDGKKLKIEHEKLYQLTD